MALPPTDINECELGVDTCHESATCSDVIGGAESFSCSCNPGYTGDGTSCVGELTFPDDKGILCKQLGVEYIRMCV